MKKREIYYSRWFFILFSLFSFYCLILSSFYTSTQDNQTFRVIRSIEIDFENVTGELAHFASRGGEWLAGILRDFILDNPTTDNLRFFKGIKGQIREDTIAEILVLLIKDFHNQSTGYLENLTYSLRYLYLDPFTQEPLTRILITAREISERNNILPAFIPSYINQEIIGISQNIHLLDDEQGRSLTLHEIGAGPEQTYIAIMDVDYLSILNHAYGKSTLDYVLDDIRRTVVVSLSQFDSFAYTNSGRDELYITLSGVENRTQAEEILYLINQRIKDKKYLIIKLDSNTNSSISRLPPGEFEGLKQTLLKRGIGISDGAYIQGEYLLLIPLSIRQCFIKNASIDEFLGKFLPDLNDYLDKNDFDIEISGNVIYFNGVPFNMGFLPQVTVSLGATSINLEGSNPDDVYETALTRANIALRTVKREGKDDSRFYNSDMEEFEPLEEIFTSELIDKIEDSLSELTIPQEQRDPIYPNIYKSSVFREKIQKLIEQDKNGFLIWIEPEYYITADTGPLPFKVINELYGLSGGDLIIRTLFYLLVENIPSDLKDLVIIGRNPPDSLLVYLPEPSTELNAEQRGMISELLDKLKQEFEKYSQNLWINFNAAVKGTHDIFQVGRLFWLTEYTHYSIQGATVFPTDLGNIIKLYTPSVEDEIKSIQIEIQTQAFNEILLNLPEYLRDHSEGP